MPNWCSNSVRITGPNKEIKKIEKAIKEDKFLQYLHPMPAELMNTQADGSTREELVKTTGFSDWYEWRVQNWCTKWEVSADGFDPTVTEMSEDESYIDFNFESAWSPPLGAYAEYLDKNDNMTIFATYYEPGCDFMGLWDSGDDRCYTVSDYDSEDDFWSTDDGQLLDDHYGIVESKAQWEAEQETEAEVKVRELVVEKKAQNMENA